MTSAPRRYQRYPAYKDSGVEWLGEIPDGWNVQRLRATVIGCQNGVWGDDPTGEDQIGCVRVADFDRTSFRVKAIPTLRSVEPRIAAAHQLRHGDLLLEKSGGGENQPVGAVALFDLDERAVCSNFIARMPVADAFYPRFLTYLHAALYALRINTKSIKQNTGIQNLDSESYLNELAALPPFSEQFFIARYLDRETTKIDRLIAKKKRLIELLEEKRSALITRAVTKGLDPDAPMKDSGVHWLGDVPAHWQVMNLGRVVTRIEQGWSPVADDREALPDEWAVIKLSAVSANRFVPSEHKALPPEISPDLRYEVREGDFLLTRANTPELVGAACVVRETRPKLMLCDLVYRLDLLRTQVRPEFIAYWLSSSAGRYQVEVEARGASQSMVKISQGLIRAWSLVLPPVSEQEEIQTFLDREIATLDKLIRRVRDAMTALQHLRIALITAATTGKIDVREEVA